MFRDLVMARMIEPTNEDESSCTRRDPHQVRGTHGCLAAEPAPLVVKRRQLRRIWEHGASRQHPRPRTLWSCGGCTVEIEDLSSLS